MIILLLLTILFFILLYGIYSFVFRHPLRKRPNVYEIPSGALYEDHKEAMLENISDMNDSPYETVCIRADDGYRLVGRLYQKKPDSPLILFFHGYHGTSAWDGFGFYKLFKEQDFNLLMVDTRAHGASEGDITFGIQEQYDCKSWTEHAIQRFGETIPIILAGVSMGASSILMSTSLGLPHNVKALIADCGFSEPCAIIQETLKHMGLPIVPFYPLIQLSARIYGGFSLEANSPLQAIQKNTLPTLFIHGRQDSIVPVCMCDLLYENCNAPKKKVIFDNADHANSAMVDYGTYQKEILNFLQYVSD